MVYVLTTLLLLILFFIWGLVKKTNELEFEILEMKEEPEIIVYYENEKLKPYRKHEDDAGIDLRAKEQVIIDPHSQGEVKTGISLEMPKGVVGIIKTRSSFGKEGYDVTAGVIDAGYRGEISVILQNHTDYSKVIGEGDRVAQLLFLPYYDYLRLEKGRAPLNTKRGANGFGSTGRR